MNIKYLLLVSVMAIFLGVSGCSEKPATTAETTSTTQTEAARSVLVPNTQTENMENTFVADTQNTERFVTFKTTMGDIKLELFVDQAPITTDNFLKLAKSGFYDGVAFHRVISGFMIQGGDPLSKDTDPSNDGTGGPGYFIEDEFYKGSTNLTGTIAMANAGPNTGGSQFFINLENNTFLDSKHPVFGKVVEGVDIVEKIGVVETTGSPFDRPLEKIIIKSVIVE